MVVREGLTDKGEVRWSFALLLASLAVIPRIARACAVCNCGDPTLTMTGQEQPYTNRVRVSLDGRVLDFSQGAGVLRRDVTVFVNSLIASWAPHERFLLGVLLPWQLHHERTGETIIGLSDLEVSGRVVLYRDRRFAAQHLVSATAGLKTPTGPRLRDSAGYFVADDEQPGSGSWDPYVGLSYAAFPSEKWSTYFTIQGRYATANARHIQRGSAVMAMASAQYQPHQRVALQLGFETLWRDVDRLANRAAAANTGGTILRFWPGVVVNPTAGLLVRAAIGVPVYEAMRGAQNERVVAQLTLSYDIR